MVAVCKIYGWLAKYFLRRCGFNPKQIRLLFISDLFKTMSVGQKCYITSEFLEDRLISLGDIEEYFSDIKYDYETKQYICKKK